MLVLQHAVVNWVNLKHGNKGCFSEGDMGTSTVRLVVPQLHHSNFFKLVSSRRRCKGLKSHGSAHTSEGPPSEQRLTVRASWTVRSCVFFLLVPKKRFDPLGALQWTCNHAAAVPVWSSVCFSLFPAPVPRTSTCNVVRAWLLTGEGLGDVRVVLLCTVQQSMVQLAGGGCPCRLSRDRSVAGVEPFWARPAHIFPCCWSSPLNLAMPASPLHPKVCKPRPPS